MDAKHWGRAIRRWRESRTRLTQWMLAELKGVSNNTVSALENRGQGLETELFIRLCLFMGAEPLEVSDRAYYELRERLGKEADELRCPWPRGREGGATPSPAEVMRLYDEVASSGRAFVLYVLRFFGPEVALSLFLQERFQNLDLGPEPSAPKTKKRKPSRRTRRAR